MLAKESPSPLKKQPRMDAAASPSPTHAIDSAASSPLSSLDESGLVDIIGDQPSEEIVTKEEEQPEHSQQEPPQQFQQEQQQQQQLQQQQQTPVKTESFSSSAATFEEIQKQLKATLDHVEQRNMVSGFQTLSKATSVVVDNCEQLGKIIIHRCVR